MYRRLRVYENELRALCRRARSTVLAQAVERVGTRVVAFDELGNGPEENGVDTGAKQVRAHAAL